MADAEGRMRMLFSILVLGLSVTSLRALDATAATNAPPATNVAPAPAAFVDPLAAAADNAAPAAAPANGPIKRFNGRTSLTTSDFTVPDRWELRWRSDQLLSIGVLRRDNTVVAGTTGQSVGSLYVPQGGSYRLRVKASSTVLWDVQVVATLTAPTDQAFYEPTPGPEFKPLAPGANVPVAPVAAPLPAPAVAAPLAQQLTLQQRQALVTIKGDRAQGAGFFMKHGPDTVLVTTQQLIANNPNWQIFSSSGSLVQVTKIRGASDRDVAMLNVKDFGYSALEQGDPMKLKPGDTLLTAGAAGAALPPVTVASLDLLRIVTGELRPLPGSPLVLAASGRVVGVVGLGPQVLASADFGDQNFTGRDAMTGGSVTGYGQRFDNVPTWDTCDAAQLQVQTLFLGAFHQRSRVLDAYINGGGEFGSTQLWKADDKIKSANDGFLQDASGGNSAQRMQALQALLFELGVAADADMDQIQQPQNFYGYERGLARDEITYRKAIKAELDQFGGDVHRFDAVARHNNGG